MSRSATVTRAWNLVIDFLRGKGPGSSLVRELITGHRLRVTAVTAFELRVGADFLARRDDILRLARSRTFPLDLEWRFHDGPVAAVGSADDEGRQHGRRRGHRDHGIAALGLLTELYREGKLNPRPHVRVLRETDGALLHCLRLDKGMPLWQLFVPENAYTSDEKAEMAAKSDYFELGKNLANERRGDVAMNTPVERKE